MRSTLIPCLLAVLCAGRADASEPEQPPAAAPGTARRVVVYYLHSTFRCTSCNRIEELTREAILGHTPEEGDTPDESAAQGEQPGTPFREELDDGRLLFRTVNVDLEEHKHYLTDFGVKSKSVVVVEEEGDSVRRHVPLDRVWQLLQDAEKFVEYVRQAVTAALEHLQEDPSDTSGNDDV